MPDLMQAAVLAFQGDYMATSKGIGHDVRFPLANGLRHGHGKRVWANGATYNGRQEHDSKQQTWRSFTVSFCYFPRRNKTEVSRLPLFGSRFCDCVVCCCCLSEHHDDSAKSCTCACLCLCVCVLFVSLCCVRHNAERDLHVVMAKLSTQ